MEETANRRDEFPASRFETRDKRTKSYECLRTLRDDEEEKPNHEPLKHRACQNARRRIPSNSCISEESAQKVSSECGIAGGNLRGKDTFLHSKQYNGNKAN